MNNNVTYFGSLDVEHVPNGIKIFIDKSAVVGSIFKIQAYDSVICGNFCIGFINFILKGKSLAAFTNFFLPNSFDKNDDMTLEYFRTNV